MAKTDGQGGRAWPSAAILGIGIALLCLILDQASKLFLLYGTELRLTYPWAVLPFLDFTVVWNRGISYGWFQQEGEGGRWLLTAFKLLASGVLIVWLLRVTHRLEAAGLGLILGGALGNALDRILHGAVFDFVHFHLGTFSWYVFNIADAGIVVGVAFLVLAQAGFAQKSPQKGG